METLTLHIDGMTGGGCVKTVTRTLTGLYCVAKAEVSLANKNGVIESEPAKTNAAASIDAVEAGGYDAAW